MYRRGRIENPAGLLIYAIENNLPLPADFVTSRRKQALHEQQLKAQNEKDRETTVWLEYEEWREQLVEAELRARYPVPSSQTRSTKLPPNVAGLMSYLRASLQSSGRSWRSAIAQDHTRHANVQQRRSSFALLPLNCWPGHHLPAWATPITGTLGWPRFKRGLQRRKSFPSLGQIAGGAEEQQRADRESLIPNLFFSVGYWLAGFL